MYLSICILVQKQKKCVGPVSIFLK